MVRGKERQNFLSHFFVLLESCLPFDKFNLRGDFFYEIVRVTSSAKAFFEVVDVLTEGFSCALLLAQLIMLH